jgi:polyketide cyclase/dehydrase/lipid transport protein
MSTWTTHTTVTGLPDEVLELLTEPDAIRRWAPIPFEVRELDGERLTAGSLARVRGGLAGRNVEFDVEVLEAEDGRLSLVATGPMTLDVEYLVRPAPAGSEVQASVSVSGGDGLMGRLLARATDALLAGGALDTAVGRLEPALAA